MDNSSFNGSDPVVEQPHGIPEELHNSAAKILAYAGISQEKARLFMSNLDNFIKMKDKSFSDRSSRQIREQISDTFFEAYTAVFKRVRQENNPGRLYLMFLCFGYMDERLLTAEQVNTLYQIVEECPGNAASSLYNLNSWLQQIYQRTKEPSVNEFGQDYQDIFLEKKRRRELTDKDKPAYDADLDGRLNHEITSLFRLGQRLCYGQMSGYFPILHKEMISRDLKETLITPDKIESSLQKILAVDFSAFHREIVYNHTHGQMGQELIMKPVLPDIILLPCFGHRAVMWQELSGKRKNTPGRFVFPIFTDENLDNLMLGVVARFRWDLSKNMYSFVVNKANEVSLYADYNDYIQFYAKNRDLSPEAKEKLKSEIKRHRNNPAEVFTEDYKTWINYESDGLVRLNKVARQILFKHCPFSQPIRDKLRNNPNYNTFINQYEQNRARQYKLLESRYAKLQKFGDLDQDLLDNLAYYQA
ncbi:MAG TPA: hypothetical protein PLS54_08460 [Syntrophomonadaceae bacterium]|nr:hypothetical protein [Syntrophomonadaceae bacterium]